MSRIRTIKPEFWISEQVMSCSHSARLLFIGLWNFCDDGGIHAANIRKLKAEVFPGDEATLIDVDGWMKELIKQRLVVEFTAQYNGESCNFWFVTGWKHQRIDKPYLKYPPYQAQQASAITPRPFDDHSQHVPRIVEEYSAQGVEGKRKGREGKKKRRKRLAHRRRCRRCRNLNRQQQNQNRPQPRKPPGNPSPSNVASHQTGRPQTRRWRC